MKSAFTLLIVSFITSLYGQNPAVNWYFGWNAGITFNTNPPSLLSGGQTHVYEGCSSISDAFGNLLFYSEGQSVWDRNHNVMPNGTGLSGSFSSTQSCLIFQSPGISSEYYIFTSPEELTPDSFTYSKVDMTLNVGLGDITEKNTGLLKPSTEKLTAVYHHNAKDVWVIGHKSGSADFYAWLVSSSGVDTVPVISTTGIVYSGIFTDSQGFLKVSPCGNKIAAATMKNNSLELFDFDDSTGVISNPVLLCTWPGAGTYGPYGVEFSPDNSKLYTLLYSPPVIIQYDLLAGSNASIIASADTIAILPGTWGGAMQLGPDGKIYFARHLSSNIGCIHSPNLQGPSCNLVDSVISISPSPGRPGLPNFLTSYFCSLSVNIADFAVTSEQINVYPNPATDHLNVVINQQYQPCRKIELIDMYGRLKFSLPVNQADTEFIESIPVAGFQKGVYVLRLVFDRKNVTRKFVIN